MSECAIVMLISVWDVIMSIALDDVGVFFRAKIGLPVNMYYE
jgi:hypothetical protein